MMKKKYRKIAGWTILIGMVAACLGYIIVTDGIVFLIQFLGLIALITIISIVIVFAVSLILY